MPFDINGAYEVMNASCAEMLKGLRSKNGGEERHIRMMEAVAAANASSSMVGQYHTLIGRQIQILNMMDDKERKKNLSTILIPELPNMVMIEQTTPKKKVK